MLSIDQATFGGLLYVLLPSTPSLLPAAEKTPSLLGLISNILGVCSLSSKSSPTLVQTSEPHE